MQLLFGIGFGFGAALIAFGLFYKRLVYVAEQGLVEPVRTANCDALEEQLDILKECLLQREHEIAQLQAAYNQAKDELNKLKDYIEQKLEIPGYAIRVRQNERARTARKLYAAGWSKRRIVQHLWGNVGGRQYERLEGMLAEIGMPATEIVKV